MATIMTTADALKKAGEIMKLAAQAAKDRGVTTWTALEHVKASGYILRVLFAPKDPNGAKLEQTGDNYAAVFHAIYNQSAWRQKFEKDGIFAKAKAAGAAEYGVADMEEEMGE